MAYEHIQVDVEPPIATVTLNRPKVLNALSPELVGEVNQALRELDGDDRVRAVVLTGGPKVFAAGADIGDMAERSAAEQLNRDQTGAWSPISGFKKPLIAAVNGYCLGGGCELALACDIRIASENASFGQPEINLGIIPGGGGTQRLTRLVGEGRAMELILTGDIIDAKTAFAIGLVNHVVPADQLEAKTMEIANRIAEKGPIALRLAKEAVKLASRSNLDEGLRRELDLFALCFSTEDKDEGVKAFLEKRKPAFKGK